MTSSQCCDRLYNKSNHDDMLQVKSDLLISDFSVLSITGHSIGAERVWQSQHVVHICQGV